MGKVKSKSKKIEIAKLMPPKYHKLPNEDYNTKKSETIKWLLMNSSILEFLWDHIKQSGYIEYNPDTGKWQGVDYNEN